MLSETNGMLGLSPRVKVFKISIVGLVQIRLRVGGHDADILIETLPEFESLYGLHNIVFRRRVVESFVASAHNA
jgi:hypothetical protein